MLPATDATREPVDWSREGGDILHGVQRQTAAFIKHQRRRKQREAVRSRNYWSDSAGAGQPAFGMVYQFGQAQQEQHQPPRPFPVAAPPVTAKSSAASTMAATVVGPPTLLRVHDSSPNLSDYGTGGEESDGESGGTTTPTLPTVESASTLLITPTGFRRHYVGLPAADDESFVQRYGRLGLFSRTLAAYQIDVHIYEDMADIWAADALPTAASPLVVNKRGDVGGKKETTAAERGQASTTKTTFTLLKAMVGSFCLYLPGLFSRTGWVFGLAWLVGVGLISLYDMVQLSNCHTKVGGTFASLAGRAVGSVGTKLVSTSILLSQLGYCASYFKYVQSNCVAVLTSDLHLVADDSQLWNSMLFWVALQLVFYIPMSWLKDIRQMAACMMLGNACLFLGYLTTIVVSILYVAERGPQPMTEFDLRGVPTFVGSVSIAFEGIGLVLPIKRSMRHPEQFNILLVWVLLTLTVLFCSSSLLGYLAFGDHIERFITLNMPTSSGVFVRCGYSLAILLTYPIQLVPAVRVLERWLLHPRPSRTVQCAFRTVVVIGTAVVAIATGHQFDNFISLIGALCAIPLMLIYPPILALNLLEMGKLERVLNVLILIVGVCSCAMGTSHALATWQV